MVRTAGRASRRESPVAELGDGRRRARLSPHFFVLARDLGLLAVEKILDCVGLEADGVLRLQIIVHLCGRANEGHDGRSVAESEPDDVVQQHVLLLESSCLSCFRRSLAREDAEELEHVAQLQVFALAVR